MTEPTRVPDDRAEARRQNRERVASMRTGYTPVDPAWREAMPTVFASKSLCHQNGRGYTPPRERMIAKLTEQRTALLRDAHEDDPLLQSELKHINDEILRLSAAPGVT